VIAVCALPWLFFAISAHIKRSIKDKLVSFTKTTQAEVIRRLHPQNPVKLPVLAIRFIGDEASLWLNLLQGISNIPFAIGRVASALSRAGAILSLLLVLILAELEMHFPGIIFLDKNKPYYLLLWLGIILAAWLPMIAVWPFMVALPPIIRGHMLGFGKEALIENLLSNIKACDSPSYCMSIKTCNYGLAALINRIGLRIFLSRILKGRPIHSLIYEDAAVVTEIADWIKSTSKAARTVMP
jgi:hypothetical protein